MAGNIVNLGDLVPGIEGTTFHLPKGEDADGNPIVETYYVPGDLDSETVFEFLGLFESMSEMMIERKRLVDEAGDDLVKQRDATREILANMKKLNEDIQAKLLPIFQLSDPDLKSLPFGAQATSVVLGIILEMMGLAVPIADGDLPLPPTEGTNRQQRRATGKKTTTRSTSRAASRTPQKATG